jgi:hypothetical protein
MLLVIVEQVAVVDRGRWSRRWRRSSLVTAGAAHRRKVGGCSGGCAAARVCVVGDQTSACPLYIRWRWLATAR